MALPICVKEIASNGPGLVYRIYRVEVYANNGMLMGSTDINNEQDLKAVLGGSGRNLLDAANAGDGDMLDVFNHIANEKVDS